MDFGIKGKRALVCAGSRGLGKAIAMALAYEGVDLLLCARDIGALAATKNEIEKDTGARCYQKVCDITDPEDREKLVSYINQTLGFVDILIHNVGGPRTCHAEDTTVEDWQNATKQLLLPVVDLNNAFLPGMKNAKWGRIVCVTSLSVLEPIANLALSNGLRSAVTGMLKTLADEVAPKNITVNCVAPGLIRTSRTEELMKERIKETKQSKEAYMKEYVKPIPMGRLGNPNEFGAVVAFLCSQQASYITGSTISVDGGKRRSIT